MEGYITKLIAEDRLQLPIASLEQKLRSKKMKDAKNIAESIGADERFDGNRVYAFVEEEDKERARGMKQAIAEFAKEFPKYGAILNGKIAEKRKLSEKYLYFGINSGCKLATEDYLGVLQNVGLTERAARELYPELLNISRKLAKAKGEERSIIVGTYK